MKIIFAIQVPEDIRVRLGQRLGHHVQGRRSSANHEEIVTFLQYWIDAGWEHLRSPDSLQPPYPPLESEASEDLEDEVV